MGSRASLYLRLPVLVRSRFLPQDRERAKPAVDPLSDRPRERRCSPWYVRKPLRRAIGAAA